MSQSTVYKYLSGPAEVVAESCYQAPAFTNEEPFREETIRLLKDNKVVEEVYERIKGKGYAGGMSQFYKYCAHLVKTGIVEKQERLPKGEFRDKQTNQRYHYISRKQIVKYIWNGGGDISGDDIGFIKTLFPVINVLIECLCKFRKIFETKSEEVLSEFTTTYKVCKVELIRKYAESIQRDIGPVTNAVVEEYSNGFVEGTNNKLKMIKRQGYGRCKLPLLKSKIVLPGFFWPYNTQI